MGECPSRLFGLRKQIMIQYCQIYEVSIVVFLNIEVDMVKHMLRLECELSREPLIKLLCFYWTGYTAHTFTSNTNLIWKLISFIVKDQMKIVQPGEPVHWTGPVLYEWIGWYQFCKFLFINISVWGHCSPNNTEILKQNISVGQLDLAQVHAISFVCRVR